MKYDAVHLFVSAANVTVGTIGLITAIAIWHLGPPMAAIAVVVASMLAYAVGAAGLVGYINGW